MLLENYVGLVLLLSTALLMVLVVPFQRIKDLFIVGLIGGFGGGLVLIHVMQNIFGFWEFLRGSDLLFLLNIPIFISLAWLPIVITFCHLLNQYNNISLIVTIIIAFPLAATSVKYLMLENGMLNYDNWGLLYTFLLSLAIHIGLTAYMYISNRLDNFKRVF